MSTQHTAFEIFISYSRKDNAPMHPGEEGWVSALRDHILEDHRRFSTEPLRIFLDATEIQDIQDWRHRILGALRRSKILLVCLSPNYFESDYCEWEWEEYVRRQVHQLAGSDSIAAVYFVELPESNAGQNAKWRESVYRGNYTDIRRWFPEGARALQHEEVRRRMAKLGESLWKCIRSARRADGIPSNLRQQNPHFVGRSEELRQLHEHLGVGTVGVVTAVHGLGGQGKTELAVSYAHGWADCYPAGLWVLGAEGERELLPLIGELAFAPELAYTPTEAQKADPALLGRAVLAELQRRAAALREKDPDGGAAALLLLDNVSDSALLSPAQLSTVPRADWLRIVATSRLGPAQFGEEEGKEKQRAKEIALIEVKSLEERDALALICDHQPGQRFSVPAEEEAAQEIVRALGGFTLAVEQVAVYLGLHPSVTPSALLDSLRTRGLTRADELVEKLKAEGREGYLRHQQKQLGLILETTLALLDAPARTTLRFAALLPSDTVPLPWLRELTAARYRQSTIRRLSSAFVSRVRAITNPRHRESARPAPDEPDRWVETCRRLEGMRLLTPGDRTAFGRIHRLVAAHIVAEDGTGRHARALRKFVAHRALKVAESPTPPSPWEMDALCVVLPPLLATAPSRELAVPASSLSNKARAYHSLSAAATLLEAAVPAFQRLAEEAPKNSERLRDVSVSLGKLGDVARAQGKLGDARRHVTEALQIAKRLLDGNPRIAERRRDVSVSLNKLGEVARAQGDVVEAQRCFDEGLKLAQSLAETKQGNFGRGRDVVASLNQQGDLAIARGDVTEAHRLFAEGHEIAQRLQAASPADAMLQRDLAASCCRLGDAELARGELGEARRLFTMGHRLAQVLAIVDPTNVELQRDLSATGVRLGVVAMAQGSLGEAQRLFAEGLEIARNLADADPTNTERQRNLSVLLNNVVSVAMAQGNLVEAQQPAKESLRIAQRLAEADPTNRELQRDLAASLNQLGRVATKYGKLDVAQALFAEGLKIAQSLVDADPANAVWECDLALAHYNLGYLALERTDVAAMKSHLKRSFEILTELRHRGVHFDPETAKKYELLAPMFDEGF